jgi:hypothetical protein
MAGGNGRPISVIVSARGTRHLVHTASDVSSLTAERQLDLSGIERRLGGGDGRRPTQGRCARRQRLAERLRHLTASPCPS